MLQFLQRMLDDRAPSVDSVLDIGSNLIEQGDEQERGQIEQELQELTNRWERLAESANERQEGLQRTLRAAQQFQVIITFIEIAS